VLATGEDGVIVERDEQKVFFFLAALNSDDAGLIIDPSKQRASAPAVIREWWLKIEHCAISADVGVFGGNCGL